LRQGIGKTSKGGRLVFGALPLLILTGLFLWCVDGAVRPAVESISRQQAKSFAARCVNGAMAREMERGGVSYDELVLVTRNGAGEVTSVQTNMAGIGRLQTRLTRTVLDEAAGLQSSRIHIPLGTVFGNQLFAGRGPAVSVGLVPVGSVETRLYHQFLSAGINQTLHRIVLEADMRIQTLLPGYTVTTDTKTGYIIAETVIVGQVPEAYTQIDGGDSPMVQRFNDYQAEMP
jgi:sporulation protein YunB